MIRTLSLSINSGDYNKLLTGVLTRKEFENGRPSSLWINNKESVLFDKWNGLLASAESSSWAYWRADGPSYRKVILRPDIGHAVLEIPQAFANAVDGIELVESFAFDLCALGSIYERWCDRDAQRWGFGRSHLSHGWGCAFRGAGHDRLVSRRWLDFGPWRVFRRPNDTTFIQFHDLAITDPAAAYAQAAPGHERMGNSATGGYLQHQLDWIIDDDIRGIYLEKTHTLEAVVAPAIKVSQEDMLSMCALRLQHRLTPPPPTDRIDHVAYIFMERADAEANLHELWLRELECWYVDGSGKHRLDLDYHPVPNPPAWVRALDDK